jgi:hypothetical protein
MPGNQIFKPDWKKLHGKQVKILFDEKFQLVWALWGAEMYLIRDLKKDQSEKNS